MNVDVKSIKGLPAFVAEMERRPAHSGAGLDMCRVEIITW